MFIIDLVGVFLVQKSIHTLLQCQIALFLLSCCFECPVFQFPEIHPFSLAVSDCPVFALLLFIVPSCSSIPSVEILNNSHASKS
ncbi:hypothetical protein IMY05_019G0080400 [Salix suchowensis]|nr:hypothetical protein IMY05_019G0080400 [Salix suchowensis]